MIRKVLGTMLCALLLGVGGRALAEDYPATVREGAFAAGGVVIVDVNVGDLQIEPAEGDGRVRLVITPRTADDATAAPHWVREFSLNASQAKIAVTTPKHGHHDFTITLYVPKHSDLRVSLGVGDLKIAGVTGNTDAEVNIGDLRMEMADPQAYREVSLSVHIGDVNSGPLNLSADGFLGKSVEHEFGRGSYRLKLHTGIGDIQCSGGA